MSRLAAPCRRNGFVILQAVRSPPTALHPASRRRSCLRLHVLRLHIGWTFTSLTKQIHGRTHPRESGDPGATRRAVGPGGDTTCCGPWIPAFAGMTCWGSAVLSSVRHEFEPVPVQILSRKLLPCVRRYYHARSRG